MQTENLGGAVQIGEWFVDPALDIITRGTETQKLEPRPGSLRTPTAPPINSARRLTMDSPKPVPP